MVKKLLTDFNVKELFELWLITYILYVFLEGAESITGQNIHVYSGTI